ncbi:MAG: sensor histidine kinase [Chitinispirillaceae bacterium]
MWYQYREVLDSIKNHALEMEKIHNRLTSFNETLHSVHSLTSDLSEICCLDDLYGLPEKLRKEFKFDFCQAWIVDNDQLRCLGPKEENYKAEIFSFIEEIEWNRRETLLLRKKDSRQAETLLSRLNLGCIVMCPLKKDHKELGVLLVGNAHESISDEQICFLESITGVLVGVFEKSELEEIERKDRTLLESLSAYTSDTVARIKLFQSTQKKLEEKTLELRRVLNNLARARIKVMQNVSMSVFSLNNVHIIKEINTLLLSLSSEVNDLTSLYQTLFIVDKNRIRSQMYGEKLEYNEIIEELEFLFERTVIELQRSIRLTSKVGNVSSVVQKDVIQQANVIEIAQNAIEMISKEKWENVEIHIQPNVDAVWPVNKGHMENVFHNLFVNSLEAMNGEGKLIVAGFRKGDDLVLTVKDTGPGIALSHKKKIFHPFFSTKKADPVKGMGLALSSDIVRLYGGRLELKEDQTEGAEFSIHFSKKLSSR